MDRRMRERALESQEYQNLDVLIIFTTILLAGFNPPGGGGDSNMKMPGCVCWVSENGPILNGTFSCITYPY